MQRHALGRVELVEIPTDEETNDNIVAYWVSNAKASPEAPVTLAYSLFWTGDDRVRPPGGRTVATRQDAGTRKNTSRFVVDFEGEALRRLPADAVVEGVVTAGVGDPENPRAMRPVEILEQQVIHNPATGGWRLVFQIVAPGNDPVELRAFLRHGQNALSETWSSRLIP